ncbi:C40 family peptidase [Lacinutrix venerupis]|uniref:Glycoside hydrolase n=1 Tax=Lacinutrix venerupis TaxID=1486034 RepID=A0AAC9PXU3_9FLAO|nr:C40 family peptidase [Lacinutrix venerupis]APY01270.1 glycoside hydrolase [Lacinutrix venerupis]
MRKIALILLTIFILSSCGASKNKRVVTRKTQTTKKVNQPKVAISEIAESIINNAEKYKGTRYKYGGTTKKGMDCSGLIYTAFLEEQLRIPRTTSGLSSYGDWIDLKKVREGDLVFFATKKNSRKVNHVGLVTATNGDNVEFIHASTSKGVMTSNIKEKYWYFAFVQARRVL